MLKKGVKKAIGVIKKEKSRGREGGVGGVIGVRIRCRS